MEGLRGSPLGYQVHREDRPQSQTHGAEDAAEAMVRNPYSCSPAQATLEGAQTWQQQMMLRTRMRRSKARASQPAALIGY